MRIARLAAVAGFLLLLAPLARAQSVVTTSGTVNGTTAAGVEKFQGIPYAQPPVGALRWQRPVPVSASPTPIDGTVPKAACTQILQSTFANACRDNAGQAAGTLVGSENCLTLSVWRPAAAPVTPRPVMVWIHGGANVAGCAKDPLTEASDLALHGPTGQVVVAIQYRLGPLGFYALPELSAEDPNGSSGNYGMLDMLAALEWVQANAAAFGGDPANVTIFGESAGGIATCALVASPLAEGLFARAISQSGNCAQGIPLQAGPGGVLPAGSTAFDRGVTLAADPALACSNPATRLACMRGKTPAQIFPPWSATPGALGFPPANMALDGYFAHEQPAAVIGTATTPTVPLLIGSNANEMTAFTLGLSLPTATDYENLIRAQSGDYVADLLLPIWPANEFPTPLAAYQRLGEDIFFVCPSFQIANAVERQGGVSYAYHFAYDPGVGFATVLKSFHGLELYSVFGNLSGLSSLFITPDAGDTALSAAMQDAWTSFARTGVPSSTPAWPAFDSGAGGLASEGSALVWNVSPANALANSVSLTGALRDGRCAELEALGATLNPDVDGATSDVDNCDFVANSDQADHDVDSVGTACDNCRYAANLSQLDSAGVAGAGPDGIGNACQCGDADDDADVDAGDVLQLRLALAGSAVLPPAAAAKCSVRGTAGCDVVDSAVLRRALLSLQPGIAESCTASLPL